MSDAAVISIISGVVTIAGMFVGWLTLNSKLKYGAEKVEEGIAATAAVEGKLDSNTLLTRGVDTKATAIVEQTDGALSETRSMVAAIAERVEKLEEYNHTSAHRALNAINVLTLKVERLLVMHEVKVIAMPLPPPPGEGGPP